ncbi:ECF-type sigma factor [Stieleria varia]|uniref:ECF sigma factor n=1 Tax=Stieleria varia TaxID=2528005 RepID=A0A5C6A099_9BACT|nr:ECF-type sigma factor [Stieleria varia]TWT92737.1 ECF sigma factor [Stieleria varia]
MDEGNSIAVWIDAVRRGDESAAGELWRRYFHQLMHLARSRMRTLPRATYDEEDAAISTFRVLCQKLQDGDYPAVQRHDELWRLMLTILIRKINRRAEYESADKRGAPATGTDLPDPISVEWIQAGVSDECEHLLRKLDDPHLERVALWKLDGYTDDEIAKKLNRTRRTVQRMLRLIRDIWEHELDEHDS